MLRKGVLHSDLVGNISVQDDHDWVSKRPGIEIVIVAQIVLVLDESPKPISRISSLIPYQERFVGKPTSEERRA
jgi:hypothetical protein